MRRVRRSRASLAMEYGFDGLDSIRTQRLRAAGGLPPPSDRTGDRSMPGRMRRLRLRRESSAQRDGAADPGRDRAAAPAARTRPRTESSSGGPEGGAGDRPVLRRCAMTMLRFIPLTALMAAAASIPAAAWAQDASVQTAESLVGAEAGDSLYRTYCAGCHGSTGKGDGARAPSLRVRPSDLTRLARKSEKFDADKVARAIDGRKEVAGHGGSDMPKWGDAFKRSGEGYSDNAVKDRI